MPELEVIEHKLEMSPGVTMVVARMRTNPEEFFGPADKWKFLFVEKYREVLTEVEKGAIYEALKEVRRQEFSALAMAALLGEKELESDEEQFHKARQSAYANSVKEQMRVTGNSIGIGIGPQTQTQTQTQTQGKAKKWLP